VTNNPEKLMKTILNSSLFLLAMSMIMDKSFALTDYQIKKICEKEKKESTCTKSLKEKRSNLQKGIFIEIPVIPFKK